MSEVDLKGSGGADQNAGGNSGENQDPKEQKDVVKYETYKKVLDEKKRRDGELDELKKRLNTLEAEKAEKEKKEAEAKGDLQKLLELERQEKAKARQELDEIKGTLASGSKLKAVLDSINGKVDEQYWKLLDLDKVVIDPNTGLPDQTSVQAAAKEFETNYALVIKKPTSAKLPNDAPQGGGGKLTYEAWLKLPLKEKGERMKEVMELKYK